MEEKYKTCKHSTSRVDELIVYVHPTCPRLSMIKSTLCSSKIRCMECRSWEEKPGEYEYGEMHG